MTDMLRVSFEVGCGVDHAFATWTERIGTWWPADHTLSGGPVLIVLEGRVGGRIYERTAQGEEHDWGVVTVWRPPAELAYRWHLGVGADSATMVAVTFSALDDERTRVQIEQTGWERLGAAAPEQRSRNRAGWESLKPHFCAAVED
jgi:Activator of Hsp90 ATPase homolog 1-like protein